jgi:hypothetical protein
MRYKVGDILQFKNSSLRMEIIEVRDTGYTYKKRMGSLGIVQRNSENDVDCFITDGWHKV